MRVIKAALAGLALSGLMSGAQAAIIAPVSGTASSEFSSRTSIEKTFDQSGLLINASSGGYTSGVDSFSNFVALKPTHALNFDKKWFSEFGATSAQLDYDLGSVQSIQRMAIWAEEAAGFGNLTLRFSQDNVNFMTLLNNAPVRDNPAGVNPRAQVFGAEGGPWLRARYVRLELSGCPASGTLEFCGLSEIAFGTPEGGLSLLSSSLAAPGSPAAGSAAVPVPAGFALMAPALVGLFLVTRRRR